jgi:hypothetical protein
MALWSSWVMTNKGIFSLFFPIKLTMIYCSANDNQGQMEMFE